MSMCSPFFSLPLCVLFLFFFAIKTLKIRNEQQVNGIKVGPGDTPVGMVQCNQGQRGDGGRREMRDKVRFWRVDRGFRVGQLSAIKSAGQCTGK